MLFFPMSLPGTLPVRCLSLPPPYSQLLHVLHQTLKTFREIVLRKIRQCSFKESKLMCSHNTVCEHAVALKFLKCLCFTDKAGIKQFCTTEGRKSGPLGFSEFVFGYHLSCLCWSSQQALLTCPVCCNRYFCFPERKKLGHLRDCSVATFPLYS